MRTQLCERCESGAYVSVNYGPLWNISSDYYSDYYHASFIRRFFDRSERRWNVNMDSWGMDAIDGHQPLHSTFGVRPFLISISVGFSFGRLTSDKCMRLIQLPSPSQRLTQIRCFISTERRANYRPLTKNSLPNGQIHMHVRHIWRVSKMWTDDDDGHDDAIDKN